MVIVDAWRCPHDPIETPIFLGPTPASVPPLVLLPHYFRYCLLSRKGLRNLWNIERVPDHQGLLCVVNFSSTSSIVP